MSDEDLKKIGDLITDSEKRLVIEVSNFVNNTILPQLDEKSDKADLEFLASKTDIDRLERKLDRIFDKDLEQDQRLGDLESISLVAHELKLKKHKIS